MRVESTRTDPGVCTPPLRSDEAPRPGAGGKRANKTVGGGVSNSGTGARKRDGEAGIGNRANEDQTK